MGSKRQGEKKGENRMDRILITGSSGFLGSRIVRYYQGRYKVFAPSHEEMDITQPESVAAYMKMVSPDMVIHCAAASDVGWCQKNPEHSREMNVKGTEHVAMACRESGAKLVYCSSDQVYFGSEKKEPHAESEVLKPANEYGRQKLEAEKLCLSYGRENVALRLSWMYDIEKAEEKEHGNFFLTLAETITQGKAFVCPVYDYRGITDVRLVVTYLEQVFSLPGGVYNYGSEQTYNTYEMAVRLFQECGLPQELLKENKTAFSGNPRNIRMSMDKAGGYGIRFPDTLDQLAAAWRKFSQKF